MTKKFPTKKVSKITETVSSGSRSGAFCEWNTGTLDELKMLVDCGAADLEDKQNNSPSIAEFLKLLNPYKDKVVLIGYVVYPPRPDARVSVEGFTATNLDKKQVADLLNLFSHADEGDIDKDNGSVRFWWD